MSDHVSHPYETIARTVVFVRLIMMKTEYKVGDSDPDCFSRVVRNLVVEAVDDVIHRNVVPNVVQKFNAICGPSPYSVT
jgi:hypothetical protein